MGTVRLGLSSGFNPAVSAKEPDSTTTMMPSPDAGIVKLGMIDLRAVAKPAPDYPSFARIADLRSRMLIEVLVNEQGSVENARVLSGHPIMANACVAAARKAKFTPVWIAQRAVRFAGILSYEMGSEPADQDPAG
jgi:TonB family protein